jgi:hypothetical protein
MTRASIFFARLFRKEWMACRVKPGNDDLCRFPGDQRFLAAQEKRLYMSRALSALRLAV